jgi:hypothetical protein
MISLNTRHYEKWMGQNGQNDSQGCRIYWHTTRHHKKVGVSKKLENLSSTTSTVHRADKQASAREFDFEGPSVTGTASREVSNIMDITPIWLVFSAVCFVTLWVILDLIRVSTDTIAKQSGRGGIK